MNKITKTAHDADFVFDDFYVAGPLSLNLREKSVKTMTGAEISLEEKEFDALLALAEKEGEALTIEKLQNIWNDTNYIEATAAINSLSKKIYEAGLGFVWIERDAERGYSFKTRWGRSVNNSEADGNEISKAENITENVYEQENKAAAVKANRRRRKIFRTINGLAATAAVALFAFIMPLLGHRELERCPAYKHGSVNGNEHGNRLNDNAMGIGVVEVCTTNSGIIYIDIDEQNTPLAGFLGCSEKNVRIADQTEGAEHEVKYEDGKITLYNPVSSGQVLVFEVVDLCNGEVVFTSPAVNPGESFIKTLDAVEMSLMVNTRVYN